MSNYCIHCMSRMNGETCDACGRDNSEYQAISHHLQPGTVLNEKYLIGEVLGEGGFGITYIGRDRTLDLKVAIKEFYPSGMVNRNNTFSQEVTVNVGDTQKVYDKGKRNFLTEARTLAKFSMEPSIVSVREYFSANNTAYIVMDYLEGVDLKTYIAKKGTLTFEETFNILSPIMVALNKIHEQGLIHRDISPANIMILKDGRAKLLDFGAARDVSGADEKSLSITLKPGYAPEEQYRTRGKQGPWTDVYALSATMYKAITGVTPDDSMNRLYSDEIKRITELNPCITPEQEKVILKGMAVRQEDRYQTIEELRNACMACLNEVSAKESPDFGTKKKEEETKFCQHCGKKISVNSTFCRFCGVKQTITTQDNSGRKEERTMGVWDAGLQSNTQQQRVNVMQQQNQHQVQPQPWNQQKEQIWSQPQPWNQQKEQTWSQPQSWNQQKEQTWSQPQPWNQQKEQTWSQPQNQAVYNQAQFSNTKAHNGSVEFGEAIKLFFVNYVNFSGRASKSEYWWGFLFNFIATVIASILSSVVPPLGGLITMALMIPGLSLAVRRLHDIGKPGSYWFLGFIPLVGSIILLIYFCKESDGDNQWGPGPEQVNKFTNNYYMH